MPSGFTAARLPPVNIVDTHRQRCRRSQHPLRALGVVVPAIASWHEAFLHLLHLLVPPCEEKGDAKHRSLFSISAQAYLGTAFDADRSLFSIPRFREGRDSEGSKRR